MTEYLIRRILQSLLVLFLISIVTFGLIHAAPGGPTQIFLSPCDADILVRYSLAKLFLH